MSKTKWSKYSPEASHRSSSASMTVIILRPRGRRPGKFTVHLAAPVDRLPTRVLQLDARRADCAQSRLPGGLSSQRLPGEVVHNCPQTYARRPANQTADASCAHHAVAQAIWCMTTA